MFVSVKSGVLVGISGFAILAEVHVTGGLPAFQLVGHVDSVCRESRDRVRAAVLSSGYKWPETRVTVNLAPTSERKTGSGVDLAIAIAVLAANGEISPQVLDDFAFFGELGLDGTVRSIPGVLSLVSACDARQIVVPATNATEASLVPGARIRGVATLTEVVEALCARSSWPPDRSAAPPAIKTLFQPDLAEVRGQSAARFALEVAAAGGHHVAFRGEPGAGKSMLAQRLPGLLDDLNEAQSLMTTMIHSAAGLPLPAGALITRPPYRAPHHTSTYVSLVGGGSGASLKPGELSLAANGVLFLDELSEFSPYVLDTLRQPLEDGVVRISRAGRFVEFPCDTQLVVAYNPCACGMYQSSRPGAFCSCSESTRQRYARRLSGPLLDRFDLRVVLQRPSGAELFDDQPGESTATVRARVTQARRRALVRQGSVNSRLGVDALNDMVDADASIGRLLRSELDKGRLSARGVHRILRVSRTIADLRDSDAVSIDDVFVALGLRNGAEHDDVCDGAA
jgi:magnesium chelatase family protein